MGKSCRITGVVHLPPCLLYTSYLADKVFGGDKGITAEPVKEDVESFEAFMKRYARGLAIEKAAVEHMG